MRMYILNIDIVSLIEWNDFGFEICLVHALKKLKNKTKETWEKVEKNNSMFQVDSMAISKCMHVCMYVRMYVCIYACMYVCMYVCMLECM